MWNSPKMWNRPKDVKQAQRGETGERSAILFQCFQKKVKIVGVEIVEVEFVEG